MAVTYAHMLSTFLFLATGLIEGSTGFTSINTKSSHSSIDSCNTVHFCFYSLSSFFQLIMNELFLQLFTEILPRWVQMGVKRRKRMCRSGYLIIRSHCLFKVLCSVTA
jgi:hypothetical protein